MKKQVFLYGILLAALGIGLKLIEYQFVIRNHAIEIYSGIIAIFFTVLGVIAGRKLTRRKEIVIERTVERQPVLAVASDNQLEQLGISKREYEILQLMAEGLSNQEIAERTFVSIHTVKTHVSNLLFKLDAKRRTQAVIKAREMNLIS